MVVSKTLFIGTFTIICLRIREMSFLDDGYDSSGTLGPFCLRSSLVTPQAPYICSGNLLYTQQ